MDDSIQARWAKMSALRKSYLGAPPPANSGSQGFNVSSNVQDSQARILQFFNFIGSSSGNVNAAIEVPVTKSADSPMKKNLPPILCLTIRIDPVGTSLNWEEDGIKLQKHWTRKDQHD